MLGLVKGFRCATDEKQSTKGVADDAQRGKVACGDVICPPRPAPSNVGSSPTPNNRHLKLQKRYHFEQSKSNQNIQYNLQELVMAGRRIAIVGIPVAAIGGYYFYAAGGDSKVAQKKAERLSTGNDKAELRLQADMN